ncbi:hypothetical protein ATKI12_5973 [Kitasatospora sp. Ki12]
MTYWPVRSSNVVGAVTGAPIPVHRPADQQLAGPPVAGRPPAPPKGN